MMLRSKRTKVAELGFQRNQDDDGGEGHPDAEAKDDLVAVDCWLHACAAGDGGHQAAPD